MICFNLNNAGIAQVASLELPVALGQTVLTHLLTSPPQNLLHPDLSPGQMFLFSAPDFLDDEDGGGQEEAGSHHQEDRAANSEVSLVNILD